MRNRLIILTTIITYFSVNVYAQNSGTISGQDTDRNVIATAVPFLTIAPDPVSGAMGDVGVATTPDINSTFWNPAKLTFINQNSGLGLTFTPWLKKYVDDMSLSYLSGYKKLDDEQTGNQ